MNDKDPRKLNEDDIKKMLENLKNKKHQKNTAISFGFLLHKHFAVHMALSLFINFLMSAVVIGLAAGIEQPLVAIEPLGYILAIILLTLIENFVKTLLFKYFMRAMILSMGSLSLIVQIVILYIVDHVFVIGFSFNGIEHLIIFAFLFTIFRLIISIYIRRRLYMKNIRFLKGDSK